MPVSHAEMADSICNSVLSRNAFNTESFSENRKILLNQYNHLCNNEYESLDEATSAASSSGLSIGYGGFSLGASDATRNATGKYTFKSSNYCTEFKQAFNLDSTSEYRKQSTDMALSVWNSCIKNVHSNQLYATYSQSTDGTSVVGTLFRSLGSTGGYGSIRGFSVSPKGANLECSVGTTAFTTGTEKIYPLVANPTNFSCTKSAGETIEVSLHTDQGDPAWFKLLSVDDVKLDNQIERLTGQNEKLESERNKLSKDNASLNGDLSKVRQELSNVLSLKKDELRVRIANGQNHHGFKMYAMPNGNFVTVKFAVDGGIGESSCTLDLSGEEDIIRCDTPIAINANSVYNSFHANGTITLEKRRGAIRFTGSLIISAIGQVDYDNGVILTIR